MTTNEKPENKTDPYLALRYLGIIEVITYVAMLFWMFFPQDSSVLYSFGSVFLVFYLSALITLAPSVITYITAPVHRDPMKIKTARTLQKTLFIQVCIAILPSIPLMNTTIAPAISCLLGFFFFAFTVTFTNPILAELPQPPIPMTMATPEPEQVQVHRVLYCSKCGAQLGPNGLCPTCA